MAKKINKKVTEKLSKYADINGRLIYFAGKRATIEVSQTTKHAVVTVVKFIPFIVKGKERWKKTAEKLGEWKITPSAKTPPEVSALRKAPIWRH